MRRQLRGEGKAVPEAVGVSHRALGDLLPRARGADDKAGEVGQRYDSRLYKIGLGRAHKGRSVKLLIADQEIRVIDANGELSAGSRSTPAATTSGSAGG
jgi:hypothetical protein